MYRYKNPYCHLRMMAWAGAAVQAGGSLVNGIFGTTQNNKTQKALQASDQQFNMEEASKQRYWESNEAGKNRLFTTSERLAQQDWQKAMMDYQNEYNTPENQLNRMERAGLNPNLWQMNSTTSASPSGVPSGASQSVPTGAAASSSHSASNPFVPMSIDNPALVASQTRLNNANAQALEDENARKNDEHPFNLASKYVSLVQQGEDVKLSRKQQNLLDKQAREIDKKMDYMDTQIDFQKIQNSIARMDESEKKIHLEHYEDDLVSQIEERKSHVRFEESEIRKAASVIYSNMQQGNFYKASAQKVGTENRLLGMDEVLRGVKIRAIFSDPEHYDEYVDLVWDSTKNQFKLEEAEAKKADADARKASVEADKEERKAALRGKYLIYQMGLDAVEDFTESVKISLIRLPAPK